MKRIVVALFVLALSGASLYTANQAEAGALVSQAIVITCEGLSGPIDFTADRDTVDVLDLNEERFIERVFDGDGLIYETNTPEVIPVGVSSGFGPFFVPYEFRSNPLRYQLVSLAGNGFEEQVVFETTATCATLPTRGGCGLADGGYQMALTTNVQLFWDANTTRAVVPPTYIPAGSVVTIMDNNTEGWYRILWACAYYYIPVGSEVPNSAAISKPPIFGR
jgi:hypothetical protein